MIFVWVFDLKSRNRVLSWFVINGFSWFVIKGKGKGIKDDKQEY